MTSREVLELAAKATVVSVLVPLVGSDLYPVCSYGVRPVPATVSAALSRDAYVQALVAIPGGGRGWVNVAAGHVILGPLPVAA